MPQPLCRTLSPAHCTSFRSRLVCRDRLRISFSFMARSHLRVHLFHSHYHCQPKFNKIMLQRLQRPLPLFVTFFQFVCGKVLHGSLCQCTSLLPATWQHFILIYSIWPSKLARRVRPMPCKQTKIKTVSRESTKRLTSRQCHLIIPLAAPTKPTLANIHNSALFKQIFCFSRHFLHTPHFPCRHRGNLRVTTNLSIEV